jgi:hypothetical protein
MKIHADCAALWARHVRKGNVASTACGEVPVPMTEAKFRPYSFATWMANLERRKSESQ